MTMKQLRLFGATFDLNEPPPEEDLETEFSLSVAKCHESAVAFDLEEIGRRRITKGISLECLKSRASEVVPVHMEDGVVQVKIPKSEKRRVPDLEISLSPSSDLASPRHCSDVETTQPLEVIQKDETGKDPQQDLSLLQMVVGTNAPLLNGDERRHARFVSTLRGASKVEIMGNKLITAEEEAKAKSIEEGNMKEHEKAPPSGFLTRMPVSSKMKCEGQIPEALPIKVERPADLQQSQQDADGNHREKSEICGGEGRDLHHSEGKQNEEKSTVLRLVKIKIKAPTPLKDKATGMVAHHDGTKTLKPMEARKAGEGEQQAWNAQASTLTRGTIDGLPHREDKKPTASMMQVDNKHRDVYVRRKDANVTPVDRRPSQKAQSFHAAPEPLGIEAFLLRPLKREPGCSTPASKHHGTEIKKKSLSGPPSAEAQVTGRESSMRIQFVHEEQGGYGLARQQTSRGKRKSTSSDDPPVEVQALRGRLGNKRVRPPQQGNSTLTEFHSGEGGRQDRGDNNRHHQLPYQHEHPHPQPQQGVSTDRHTRISGEPSGIRQVENDHGRNHQTITELNQLLLNRKRVPEEPAEAGQEGEAKRKTVFNRLHKGGQSPEEQAASAGRVTRQILSPVNMRNFSEREGVTSVQEDVWVNDGMDDRALTFNAGHPLAGRLGTGAPRPPSVFTQRPHDSLFRDSPLPRLVHSEELDQSRMLCVMHVPTRDVDKHSLLLNITIFFESLWTNAGNGMKGHQNVLLTGVRVLDRKNIAFVEFVEREISLEVLALVRTSKNLEIMGSGPVSIAAANPKASSRRNRAANRPQALEGRLGERLQRV